MGKLDANNSVSERLLCQPILGVLLVSGAANASYPMLGAPVMKRPVRLESFLPHSSVLPASKIDEVSSVQS